MSCVEFTSHKERGGGGPTSDQSQRMSDFPTLAISSNGTSKTCLQNVLRWLYFSQITGRAGRAGRDEEEDQSQPNV